MGAPLVDSLDPWWYIFDRCQLCLITRNFRTDLSGQCYNNCSPARPLFPHTRVLAVQST